VSVDDKVVTFYLEARCGGTRVATQRAVSVGSFNLYRDRGFFGLYEGTVREMELELGTYVKTLVDSATETPRDE
jgi:hypothetical protein